MRCARLREAHSPQLMAHSSGRWGDSMRRRRADRREPTADARYQNVLVGKFIRMLMYDGKLSIAERILYHALDDLQQKTQQPDAVAAFQKALENARPALEVKSRR